MKKYVAVIQVRNNSTRLPSKVFLTVLNKSILLYLTERIRAIKKINKIIIATTNKKEDDTFEGFARENKLSIFRGDENNVLKRIIDSISELKNDDYFIKFWADSPLIDPVLVDNIIDLFEQKYQKYDYISNNHPSTYPEGMQVEIIKVGTLRNLQNRNDLSDDDREHVTTYIWRQPGLFKVGNIENEINNHDHYRIVLDYHEDFEQIRSIIESLYPQNKLFSLQDIIFFLDSNPIVKRLNEQRYETEEQYYEKLFKK